MLGYMPEIYPDELLYSWISRYYSHNGYPSYRQALEDLLVEGNGKIHFEFTGHFNADAMKVISSMYSYRELILQHTMFPYYARFDSLERRQNALAGLIAGDSKVDSLMQFQNDKVHHHLKFCPLCSSEDKEKYGETYFHRIHQIRNIGTCAKHQCKLVETPIRLYGNASPRLHVAEEIISKDAETITSSEFEVIFFSYLVELFNAPINFANSVLIGEYIASRLEGTQYQPPTKSCIYCKVLADDINHFYGQVCILKHQIQKIITGERIDFTQIARIGFFLGITINELANPIIVHKGKPYIPNPRKPHNHDVRSGLQKENWNAMDSVSLPLVQKTIRDIKQGHDRPGRITSRIICKTMGWPSKRLDYLPSCKAEVLKNIEPIEEFWAKEIVWAYSKVKKDAGKRRIFWRDIRKLINIRKGQFISTFPILGKYTTQKIADEIKIL